MYAKLVKRINYTEWTRLPRNITRDSPHLPLLVLSLSPGLHPAAGTEVRSHGPRWPVWGGRSLCECASTRTRTLRVWQKFLWLLSELTASAAPNMELFLPLVVGKVHYSKLYGQKYLVLLIPNKGNDNATAYTDILDNGVRPTISGRLCLVPAWQSQVHKLVVFLVWHGRTRPAFIEPWLDPIQHLQPNCYFKCWHCTNIDMLKLEFDISLNITFLCVSISCCENAKKNPVG